MSADHVCWFAQLMPLYSPGQYSYYLGLSCWKDWIPRSSLGMTSSVFVMPDLIGHPEKMGSKQGMNILNRIA